MDVFPKFIIEDGNLILSKVTYHREMATNPDNVKGGGWFNYKDGTFTLSGESHDFGPAKLEDIKKAVEEDKVFTNPSCIHSIANDNKFVYDTKSELIPLN